jgi:hypothetical protein
MFGHGTVTRRGTTDMVWSARVCSGSGVVAMGMVEVTTLHF